MSKIWVFDEIEYDELPLAFGGRWPVGVGLRIYERNGLGERRLVKTIQVRIDQKSDLEHTDEEDK